MTNRQGSTARSVRARGLAALGATLLLVVAACGDDDDGGDAAATTTATTAAAATTTTRAAGTTTAAASTTTRAAATTTAAAGATTTAGQAKGTIKIGTIGSTVSATTGQPILDETGEIARAWVKQVNDDGGINGYKIELVVKDGQNDTAGVLQAFTELDQEGVHAIAGQSVATRITGSIAKINEAKLPDHRRHAVHAGVRHRPATSSR